MRVLSDIAERAVLLVDGAASRWLRRIGEGETVSAAAVASLRRLAFCGGVAFVAVPAFLSVFMKPALALPLGATVVSALFLILAALAFAWPRNVVRPVANAPAVDDIAFHACPGLALIVDPQGRVVKLGGRDHAAFPDKLKAGLGEMLAEIVHVSDRLALLQAVDTLRQGGRNAIVDIRVERPFSAVGGRQFLHMSFDMSAIRDGEGDLVQIFVQALDRSAEERLRVEAENRTIEAQSAHEAKSRFLAAVSHELRTPLNAILGFSDVLAGEYFGKLANDRQREYVGLIRQSGGHLLSVVTTMLDMSKIEAGRYELLAEPFHISEAVEACRAMLDHSAREKGVTLTARTNRNLAEVVADRRALQQVLINLAGNAIKFTPAGGVVSIDATVVAGELVITVSDTGIGIAADKLATIGQPFTQIENDLSRQYEGTGLGLSLVKGLIALHGGRFTIESRLGEGTVVTIALPSDGSGIEGAAVDDGEERVEFPPRLMISNKPVTNRQQAHIAPEILTTMMDEEDFTDGPAKAKIA
uniref:sensor histidine kinase n=1 Tax=Rhizobium sp. CFBP 8752 TaxID=2775301 RepID=UPI0031456F05